MSLTGSNFFGINRGNGLPSTQRKGGTPEDPRQKVKPMEAVAEMESPAKVGRIIPSTDSPERIAGMWLDSQIALSKSSGAFAQVVTVGPALARALLNRNANNRKVSADAVTQYARDMANGGWVFNGEPIIVSNDGHLNDGQHRCEAIISADVEVDMLVVIGVERSSRTTVDQGRARTVGDYLSMDGHIDTNCLGAICSFAWQYTNYRRIRINPKLRPTKGELLAFVEDHPAIVHSLQFVSIKNANSVGGKSVLAFTHWAIGCVASRADVDSFFISLIGGANLRVGDPILYVRNRLINEGGKLGQPSRAELIIKAWNAHRAGVMIKRFEVAGGDLPKISV